MISTLLTMSKFLTFAMGSGLGLKGSGDDWSRVRRVRCTVATPGQRHLHAYCTYMVVLQIHQESVHDLFFHKKPQIFLKPHLFLYIPPKKKKKTHSPLTTLKIYKVETPCCWEMRIEKEERKMKRSQVFPQSVFKQICRVEKLHLFNIISFFPSLQSQHPPSCYFIFSS